MVDCSLTILARRCRLGEEESIPLFTFEKLSISVFAKAGPEPHHGGFIHWQPVLKDHFAAKVLAVGILHPAIQNITIRQRVGVLEQLQAHV
jgi:hypothetical protein